MFDLNECSIFFPQGKTSFFDIHKNRDTTPATLLDGADPNVRLSERST